MFSLLCRGLHFLTRIFNFLVSPFWQPEVFVPRRFVAGKFWRCNILPPKNKNLPLLYETRDICSYELSCRKFCYKRLNCNRTCFAVPASFWQRANLASWASPMWCLYGRSVVWWPKKNRARWTRSSCSRGCSYAGSFVVAGLEVIQCPLRIRCVNVGTEWYVFGEWRKVVQLFFIELGCCVVEGGGIACGLRSGAE